MNHLKSAITVLSIFALILAQCPTILAQDVGYIEDEGAALWEEQQFLDTTGLEFETQDTQYIGEDEVMAAEEAAMEAGMPSVNLVAALERDKDLMPENIQYGIITGGAIGAWMALFQGTNARDNARYLSIGILAGVVLAFVVGTKSLYEQSAGTGISATDLTFPQNQPRYSSMDSDGVSFNVTDTGKDLGASLNYKIQF